MGTAAVGSHHSSSHHRCLCPPSHECSWGNPTPGNAAYGASKRALTQLKDSLASEVAGSAVGLHICSPGMVATPMLIRYCDTPRKGRVRGRWTGDGTGAELLCRGCDAVQINPP